jgi:hypothetical protein
LGVHLEVSSGELKNNLTTAFEVGLTNRENPYTNRVLRHFKMVTICEPGCGAMAL